ncbi:MAG: hypothetical protein JST61_13135 [Acidobacteria bacterium]|nr:hypothetical protein [Acidobacteriota bacterium]
MRRLLYQSCVLAILAGSFAVAATPGYPRKTATFYAPDSPLVPKALASVPLRLPQGDVTALAKTGPVIWIGTRNGLVRYQPGMLNGVETQYLAGRRYLPDDEVLSLLPVTDRGLWVRTRTGVAYIDYQNISLDAKANLFETMQGKRHMRYGLVSDAVLDQPGDTAHSTTEPSDNDGLWTAMYAVAECYRYAATHSAVSLQRAHQSLNAVLFLTQVTGISGYPARSYVRKGESGAEGPEWHDTAGGQYRWKGDTSSDEIVGHYLLYAIAYDLLPDSDSKRRIAAAVRAITDNILNHGYSLVGETNAPTTWGKWSPAYFATNSGRPDGPLNAIELLSLFKVAAHITGDARYSKEYRHIAFDLDYARLGTRYLELREEINVSDEELFMLSIYPLMQYEKDPALLSLYQKALDQWWQNEQKEENPLWSILYQKITRGPRISLQPAIARLGNMPLNTVDWSVVNSTRRDVDMDGGTYRSRCLQSRQLLPPDELPITRWNTSPFCVDGGADGRREMEHTVFLLPYWIGKAFHLL